MRGDRNERLTILSEAEKVALSIVQELGRDQAAIAEMEAFFKEVQV